MQGIAATWVTSFFALMLYAAVMNLTSLSQYPILNCFKIMSGADLPYFNSISKTIIGPLPRLALVVMVTAGALCIALSARILETRDFT